MGHTPKVQPSRRLRLAPCHLRVSPAVGITGMGRYCPELVAVSMVGLAGRRASSWRAEIPEVSTSIAGPESRVGMALTIDNLNAALRVAALSDAGCGALRPVKIVEARRSG
jgi:hypothetical protein